jgi:hypothetical protein
MYSNVVTVKIDVKNAGVGPKSLDPYYTLATCDLCSPGQESDADAWPAKVRISERSFLNSFSWGWHNGSC